MTDHKTFEWRVKSGSVDGLKGVVTAVVSVFGNVDAQNDRVLPGAFAKSIVGWRERMSRGEYLPVVYGHQDDPSMIIGKVTGLRETDVGLEVDEQFFLTKPKARDTFDAIVAGVLPKSSFAYDVRKAKANDVGGLDLAELDVLEVGSTLYAANAATHLVGVKAALDDSPWDAGAAMAACSSAADYRAICAGERTTGQPDERQHWALPHHSRPGAPANAAGVAAARQRFASTQGLANAAEARTHLFETHRLPSDSASSSAPPAAKAEDVLPDDVVAAFKHTLDAALGAKAGREISTKNATRLMAAHDVIHDVLGLPAHDAATESTTDTETKAEEPKVKAEAQPVLVHSRSLFD